MFTKYNQTNYLFWCYCANNPIDRWWRIYKEKKNVGHDYLEEKKINFSKEKVTRREWTLRSTSYVN